jgi:hypothetical protein
MIKVQIINGASVKSAVESGFDNAIEHPLTFHAFSDAMKARILENFIKSPAKIGISFCDEPFRVGEWHEPLITDAVFNK